jgi:acylphosphatase
VPGQSPAATPAANRCRLQIFYSGRVQGVGFRYTVRTVAVRNLPDGRVELIAEGPRNELEAFSDAIRGAGLAGFIRDEKADWSAAQNNFKGFEIVQ